MRQLALAALIVVALGGCSPTPQAPAPATPPAAPAANTAMTPAAKPAETPSPAPAKEIPEGACGDQAALPDDQKAANTVRWSTASEQDNFGFDVFRGDSEKGEFKKLTADPIVGAGTSDETHKYSFRDDTIDPCKSYWYYVEGISAKGTHEKFTPTFNAPPKHRPVGSPPMTAQPAPPSKE